MAESVAAVLAFPSHHDAAMVLDRGERHREAVARQDRAQHRVHVLPPREFVGAFALAVLGRQLDGAVLGDLRQFRGHCGEALVEGLRWFDRNRDRLPELSRAARMNAERCTWDAYRHSVTDAVAPFV